VGQGGDARKSHKVRETREGGDREIKKGIGRARKREKGREGESIEGGEIRQKTEKDTGCVSQKGARVGQHVM